MPSSIAILDFGSQYAQLIARRVREAHVYCELFPWDTPSKKVLALDPKGFILSGGPASVYAEGAPTLPPYVLKSGLPILGICYGMQLLAHVLGGQVVHATQREYGLAEIQPLVPGTALDAISQVWMSHADRITRMPDGFVALAKSANSPIAAMGDFTRKYFAVQFHPEVKHTPNGAELLKHFVIAICGCAPDWTSASIIEESVRRIRAQVGGEHLLVAVSGGVDSSVAAALVHKAVGDQQVAIFVDTGLLRQGEPEQVVHTFHELMGAELVVVEASGEFLAALKGVTDPEQKRRIVGEKFIRIFEREAKKLGATSRVPSGKRDYLVPFGNRDYLAGTGTTPSHARTGTTPSRARTGIIPSRARTGIIPSRARTGTTPRFLVQGTIYPDVVESAAPDRRQAARIKSHHNVGGLPTSMEMLLVEPLRYLFKDEVRAVGEALGLPETLVWRQPFPGPGLAVRCLGEVTSQRIQCLRAADAIFTGELSAAGLLGKGAGTSQAFAVLLPVHSVGVMGDERTYQEVCAIRAVVTDDFMTADWARLPQDVLARVANRIVNEVHGINRVVYDITSKPPATIEWE